MSNAWNSHHNGDQGGSQRHTRWLTPREIPEALGIFDLDPAGAPGHELASRTYILEHGDDGLRDPWYGRVWLNPPYGRAQDAFMARMVEHGCGTALIFARTDTKSFFTYVWDEATAILFIKGRLYFHHEDGTRASANSGAASVLVAYGQQDAEALRDSGIEGKLVWL